MRVWHIKEWKPPVGLDPDLFIADQALITFNCRETCTLTWAPHYCSMTLDGNLPGGASGTEVQLATPGSPVWLKNVSITTEEDPATGKITMVGTLDIGNSTPPGTFAATTTPDH